MLRIMHNGKGLESHETFAGAARAFWIFTAHELKNGRPANLTIEGYLSSDSIPDPEACIPPLPDWAVKALKAEGFFTDFTDAIPTRPGEDLIDTAAAARNGTQRT